VNCRYCFESTVYVLSLLESVSFVSISVKPPTPSNDAFAWSVTCCATWLVVVEVQGVAVGSGVCPAAGDGAGVPYSVNCCVYVPLYENVSPSADG
jgi:hypothetical protein